MTTERSYVNRGCRHMSVCDSVVPDTRLQAIANAWENFRSMNSPLLKEMTGLVVTDLLDALTEEDK